MCNDFDVEFHVQKSLQTYLFKFRLCLFKSWWNWSKSLLYFSNRKLIVWFQNISLIPKYFSWYQNISQIPKYFSDFKNISIYSKIFLWSTRPFAPSCFCSPSPSMVSLRSSPSSPSSQSSSQEDHHQNQQNQHHHHQHECEQGLAVGLQQSSSEMLSLTIAVVVHEAIMSFRWTWTCWWWCWWL